MAQTVEYIIILTGYFEYKSIQIFKIEITTTHFILYDGNLQEIHRVGRLSGSVAIVSDFIPDLSFGERFRFVVASYQLYAVSDQDGQKEIECEVEIPTQD